MPQVQPSDTGEDLKLPPGWCFRFCPPPRHLPVSAVSRGLSASCATFSLQARPLGETRPVSPKAGAQETGKKKTTNKRNSFVLPGQLFLSCHLWLFFTEVSVCVCVCVCVYTYSVFWTTGG